MVFLLTNEGLASLNVGRRQYVEGVIAGTPRVLGRGLTVLNLP
jgi:hypothetical protein